MKKKKFMLVKGINGIALMFIGSDNKWHMDSKWLNNELQIVQKLENYIIYGIKRFMDCDYVMDKPITNDTKDINELVCNIEQLEVE